jgi:hypothetical protein
VTVRNENLWIKKGMKFPEPDPPRPPPDTSKFFFKKAGSIPKAAPAPVAETSSHPVGTRPSHPPRPVGTRQSHPYLPSTLTGRGSRPNGPLSHPVRNRRRRPPKSSPTSSRA